MDGLPDTDLIDIEERALRALHVAPAPWTALLETRHGIGGCSFIQLGNDPAVDNEMYIDVHLGARRLTSPDPQLDTVIDFVARAPEDLIRLIAEVRRLRNGPA